jgi:hypothetical protein
MTMSPQQPNQLALAQQNMAVLSNMTEMTQQVVRRLTGNQLPATIRGVPVDRAYLSDLVVAKIANKLNPPKGV